MKGNVRWLKTMSCRSVSQILPLVGLLVVLSGRPLCFRGMEATDMQEVATLQTAASEAQGQQPFYSTPASYSGIDDLGRRLPLAVPDGHAGVSADRKVGMFYFLWHGAHGPTDHVYDITRICAQVPDAGRHPELFGGYGVYHWWGEPLFGYYTNEDEWVMRRHIILLAAAGVDFVVFDATNAETYTAAAIRFLKLLLDYHRLGFQVPQAAFYTNSHSGRTLNRLYQEIYRAHPEFSPLWFMLDGRPLAIGLDDAELSAETKAFFRIKRSQWPNEVDSRGRFVYHRDGFPWMSFETRQHLFDEVSPTVMNVSVAQHCGTSAFSSSTFYGDRTNHPRCWHDGHFDPSPEALLGGANFEQQFNWAIACAPDILFVTGWNEWLAGNWSKDSRKLLFVDCCDINGSRDLEMMRGGYGDNYYMHWIAKIRQYKGLGVQRRDGARHFDFGQPTAWAAMMARYRNYPGMAIHRDARGFDGRQYRVSSGRNDIVEARMAHDDENLYLAVQVAAPLTPATDGRWMMCFLGTEGEGRPRYLGYDFVLNRHSPVDGMATLERRTTTGWEVVATCRLVCHGNEVQVEVPFAALGLDAGCPGALHFKWSDNQTDAVQEPSQTAAAFYVEGCCAPVGRLNYVYWW